MKKREPFCKYYERCLTNAAKRDVEDFDCSDCSFKRLHGDIDFIWYDIYGCGYLLRAIFYPEKYHNLRRYQGELEYLKKA